MTVKYSQRLGRLSCDAYLLDKVDAEAGVASMRKTLGLKFYGASEMTLNYWTHLCSPKHIRLKYESHSSKSTSMEDSYRQTNFGLGFEDNPQAEVGT